MKKFLLKTLDVILTIVMVVSALYAIFNLVMSFLPVEIQSTVYGWLRMSEEYIATFSVSSVINAAVLVSSKMLQTYNKVALTSELSKAKSVIAQDTAVNKVVIERQNELINNAKVLQKLCDALLSVQKVTTERNIKASDKLVYKTEKDAYKKALEDIETAKQELSEINNITSVYERTDVKEVIVEKTSDDQLDGRV